MNIVGKRILAAVVYLITSVTAGIANIAIITLIYRKRQLRKVQFFIIATFSLTDNLTSFTG